VLEEVGYLYALLLGVWLFCLALIVFAEAHLRQPRSIRCGLPAPQSLDAFTGGVRLQ
jgi:hypothetical protein